MHKGSGPATSDAFVGDWGWAVVVDRHKEPTGGAVQVAKRLAKHSDPALGVDAGGAALGGVGRVLAAARGAQADKFSDALDGEPKSLRANANRRPPAASVSRTRGWDSMGGF